MTIKELRDALNQIPENQLDFGIYVFDQNNGQSLQIEKLSIYDQKQPLSPINPLQLYIKHPINHPGER